MPISPDMIVRLASRSEGFTVSWRYRDEALMRTCRKLVAEGRLKRGKTLRGGRSMFVAVNKEIQ